MIVDARMLVVCLKACNMKAL